MNANLWLWVGCGIGGIILILFCILACIYCKRSQRSRANTKNSSQRQIVERAVSNPYANVPNSFSNTTLVSDDIESAAALDPKTEPQPLKLKEKISNSKPYGGIGESAIKPFISIQAHNKRLASITTVSSSSSSSSIAQMAQEIRRGSSPTIGTERRDSGYVDVNIPTKAQLEARRSYEMQPRKPLPSIAKKPTEHLKQRRTSNISNRVSIPTKPELQYRSSSELPNKKPAPAVAKKPMLKADHLKQRRTSNVNKSSEDEQVDNGYLTPVLSPKQRAKSDAVDHTNENEMALFRHASTGQAIDYCRKAQRMLSTKTRFEINNNSEYEPPNEHQGLRRPSNYENARRPSNYENARRPSNYENARRPSNYENARRPSNYEDIKENKNYESAERPNVNEYETAVMVTSQSDSSISSFHDYIDADVFEKRSDYTLPNQHGNKAPDKSMYELPYQENVRNNSGYETPQELSPTIHQEHYSNLNAKSESNYQNFDYSVPVVNPTSIDDENIYLEFLPENSTNDTAT